jgi:hypothetical protein
LSGQPKADGLALRREELPQSIRRGGHTVYHYAHRLAYDFGPRLGHSLAVRGIGQPPGCGPLTDPGQAGSITVSLANCQPPR